MKNKKIYNIILALIIMISACDKTYDDIYDEIDVISDPVVSAIEYTLTSDDYEAIANAIIAADPADSLNAQFIEANEFFTDAISVQDYVPYFLNEEYPWLGPGSTANITYNYNGDMPEDLEMYTETTKFEFDDDAYWEVDSLVNFAGYFYPTFEPDVYLPTVLPSLITDAEDGDMFRVNYLYSDVVPTFPEVATNELVNEGFDTDFGVLDTVNVTGEQAWYVSSYDADTYAKISGFDYPDAIENEDWLILPTSTLNSGVEITFSFTHAIKYLYYQWDLLSVVISEDYDGSNLETATWAEFEWGTDIDTSGVDLGSEYTFYTSGNIDLTSYAGKSVTLAFKYTSDTEYAATWEISDVLLIEGEKVLGKEPIELNDIYQLSGSVWEKVENVYYLNPSDYDAMGDPGDYDNFSDDALPQDYLPKYLDNLYPNAGEGVSAIVIYKYYAESTITLADEYTYTSGNWVSSYSYVAEQSGQFAVSSTTDEWVFDPTETYTMAGDDYQTIVDYVQTTYGDSYIDSYGTAEFYFGAGSYYSNFDARNGKWNSEEFDTWDEAVETALRDVFLPAFRPNATMIVNGVDMFYVINFAAYDGSVTTKYSMKFRVTSESPLTFEKVEGPTQL